MIFSKTKNILEDHFNVDKAQSTDIDINVTVLGEDNGEFSVSVHQGTCVIEDKHLDNPNITVGFIDVDTMIDMFTKGANPMTLVMGGKMTVNGDFKKGREIKGLFIKE